MFDLKSIGYEELVKHPDYRLLGEAGSVDLLFITEDLTSSITRNFPGEFRVTEVPTSVLQMILTAFTHLRDNLEFGLFPIDVVLSEGDDNDVIRNFRFKVDEYTCEGTLYDDKSGCLNVMRENTCVFNVYEDSQDTDEAKTLNMYLIEFLTEISARKQGEEKNERS